ncbi:hypothetical protein CEXT_368811 [Caerostris extrusa]|uniref:Uncharacterized protein n=1 Tax=Caerostris extrusa TaxID=172846 RepID=A0AAV4Q5N6_CAEEX|nr:hypothetical protein CEXT_368811 [Caerostris extrusa]
MGGCVRCVVYLLSEISVRRRHCNFLGGIISLQFGRKGVVSLDSSGVKRAERTWSMEALFRYKETESRNQLNSLLKYFSRSRAIALSNYFN